MNPLLSHQLTQMAQHTQDTFLAEAATARLVRRARPGDTAATPLRRLRARLAAALHALAILLDHTVASAPQVVRVAVTL